MSERLRSYGPYLVFLAAMLWASDAPFRVHLTESISSDLIVFLEHAVALCILLPLLLRQWADIRAFTLREWIAVLFIGIGGSALALLLFTESFNYMNPSAVILLQKLQPLIAITLAIAILKEITPRRFWLLTAFALLGAYLISFPQLIPRVYAGEAFDPNLIGALLALSAAFLWGASTVAGRYVLYKRSVRSVTVLRFFFAVVFLGLFNLSSGSFSQLPQMSGTDWLFIGIISITSGVVAMYIYYRGLAHSRASVATLAELGFPFAAVLVNYIFLDATLAPLQILGMLVLIMVIFELGKVNTQKHVHGNN